MRKMTAFVAAAFLAGVLALSLGTPAWAGCGATHTTSADLGTKTVVDNSSQQSKKPGG